MTIPVLIMQSAPAITNIRDWIQLVLSASTLIAIILGVIKVVNIAQKKVEETDTRVSTLEARVHKIEEGHLALEANTVEIANLSGKIETMNTSMKAEIERVRDRLDRFLDSKVRG
jgi:hypothetical protein